MRAITGAVFLLIAISGSAQIVSQEVYERADKIQWRHVQPKIHNLNVTTHWNTESTEFWYILRSDQGKEIFFYNIKSKKTSQPLDFDKVMAAIDPELESNDLTFQKIERKGKNLFYLESNRGDFDLNTSSYTLNKKDAKENNNPLERVSPDKKYTAYSNEFNLHIKGKTGAYQLSKAGVKDYEFASSYGWFDLMEGEGGDRPKRFNVSWSPNSKYIYTQICDTRNASKMYMLDFSVDSLYRPRLLGYYRGSPGDTNMVKLTPVLFDVEKRKQIPLNLPAAVHINNYNLWWLENGEKLIGMKHERGYKTLHMLLIDAATGSVDTLYIERSKTNVDTQNFNIRVLEDRGKVIITSERDGWNHLYSIDLETKELTQLTKGNFFVNSISRLDESKGTLHFMASGVDPDLNPYLQKLYRVNLDGTGLTVLTPEPYHHSISFSPDGKFFTDNYSAHNKPTTTVLRRSRDGRVVNQISEADVSHLEEIGWRSPESEKIVLDDGTELWAAVWKPTDFDPSRSYAVIDNSYTGPHTHVYPTSYLGGIRNGSVPVAELGFVVMRINGRGSSGRTKEFHNFSYKRLGYTLGDHKTVIEKLGEKYSWLDTERVGIFGHSAGGYDAAHALLQYPDFYKVGVSSSADHDHRMEKAWWPEMYMGWPVDTAYHNQSNITMAGNLKGKLLITHGGLDDNVNASASFKLAEALVKANKQFDMLIFPSQRHGYRGVFSDYFTVKRWNYFIEHLTDLEPDLNYQLIKPE